MFASYSMAFCRATIRAPQLINNVYYKFNNNALKIHLSRRQLTSKSKNSTQKRVRSGITKEKEPTLSRLSDYIRLRKDEAQRSIVVQIATWSSCKELLTYCLQFGEMTNVFYYVLPKEHHFVLIEFKNIESAKKALDAATYTDNGNIVPSRTNVMWYRKTSPNVNQSELKLGRLPRITTSNILFKEATIKNLLLDASSVSSQMLILHNEYKIPELEIRLKFQIITSLEQYFSGIFPSVVIHPFGSFINGFGNKLSDLDVVLFADGLKRENFCSKLVFHSKSANVNEKQQAHELMGVLADTMKYMIPGICNVRKIFNARVPIIKFNNIFTHTECDLSMSNVVATYMTELLYLYGEIDNRVRPLVFTIRKWARENKLTSIHPGKTITNFSLTLLVIFFLQQQKVVPSINQMHGFAEVNSLNADFLNHVYLHRVRTNWLMSGNVESLGALLLCFFKFYVNFNFCENEICLREGRTFVKRDMQPLYINNPFEQGLNVSKNVSENELERMKSLMRIAIVNIENSKFSKSTNWGILTLFNYPEPLNINLEASKILSKKNEIMSEKQEICENSETAENIQESNGDNSLSVEEVNASKQI